MAIDFRNINTLWASVLVETLARSGLKTAIACPGSRSTPLTIAFAQHPEIEAIPILDERSASFFALGIARRSQQPVVLVCTSGSAGANFYPAVIEARESRVPLLVLTADRPPELRNCNAGQAIDQQKLFGNYVNFYSEIALPSTELSMLRYLRQTTRQAWQQTQYPLAGVVHLNIPFREPLVPIEDPDVMAIGDRFPHDFFAHIQLFRPDMMSSVETRLIASLRGLSANRGIIIAGVAQPIDPKQYCESIAHLSKSLSMPVLAEGLSPLRNYASLNPYLISTYDTILRNRELSAKLAPEVVIRIGAMPTSKELRSWLTATQPTQYVIDPSDRSLDPLHGNTIQIPISIESLLYPLNASFFTPDALTFELDRSLSEQKAQCFEFDRLSSEQKMQSSEIDRSLSELNRSISEQKVQSSEIDRSSSELGSSTSELYTSSFLLDWLTADLKMRHTIDQVLSEEDSLIEGKAAWLLSQVLPEKTPLFIASSMPVRDVEFFWKPGDRLTQPFFNRGTNGIDGTLSTALGIAHTQKAVMLTGDLALLHDTNGFLIRKHFRGHLTIVLINNNGGGIFNMLPVAAFDPPFEEFFATPQNIDFAKLCQTYDVQHESIETWEQFVDRLSSLPSTGIRVLELRTDRHRDANWRKNTLNQLAQTL